MNHRSAAAAQRSAVLTNPGSFEPHKKERVKGFCVVLLVTTSASAGWLAGLQDRSAQARGRWMDADEMERKLCVSVREVEGYNRVVTKSLIYLEF